MRLMICDKRRNFVVRNTHTHTYTQFTRKANLLGKMNAGIIDSPVQILLIGNKIKSNALDLFINRKHLFYFNSEEVNANSNITNCVSTSMDDININTSAKYIDHYGTLNEDDYHFDCIIFFGKDVQDFYDTFNFNDNLANIVLDSRTKNLSAPPLPIIFVNVNNSIPTMTLMNLVSRFEQSCIFPNEYEKRMNASCRDPICGHPKIYNSMRLNKSLFTSVNIYEIFKISFVLACYHKKVIMPMEAFQYIREEEKKLNVKEKEISKLHHWQPSHHHLICIDQQRAMKTFALINKLKIHMPEDLIRHIFSNLTISFNYGSFSQKFARSAVQKMDKEVKKSHILSKKKKKAKLKKGRTTQPKKPENLSLFAESPFYNTPQYFSQPRFQTFTRRLISHVQRYNK
jgi:hypothetical protein